MIRPALSGLAGQQTYPGAPDRAADPEFRGIVGERLRGVLGAPVGVEYCPGGEGVTAARHLQRVDDQVGSHVLGHRVADAGLGVESITVAIMWNQALVKSHLESLCVTCT